jgi:hypothetical protein
MKKFNNMILIILTCIAGLITIGISVVSIIERNQKEKELKETQAKLITKQDYLIELQNKYSSVLQEKTNEIIKLQSLLRDNSESQLKQLDRINNPVPEKLEIFFSSKIEMLPLEISQIKEIVNLKSATHSGNLLPFDSNQTNEGFERISKFKNIYFRLIIAFHKDGKKMEVIFNKGPLDIFGYNTRNSKNSFTLAFLEDKSAVTFDGSLIETSDITTN